MSTKKQSDLNGIVLYKNVKQCIQKLPTVYYSFTKEKPSKLLKNVVFKHKTSLKQNKFT